MAIIPQQRRSLLSSDARIQAPWVKVTIGSYTFGVFDQKIRSQAKDDNGFYKAYDIQYPNYIQSLNIVKINGQVNQYTLSISYPVRTQDDPNFFEKVFSSVSKTRKIIFSYGDSAMPKYCYKDEEAIITRISQSFNFGNGGVAGAVIGYQIEAVSGAALCKNGSFTFTQTSGKPSDIIKSLFRNSTYGLQDIFTGMSLKNLDSLIAGDDKVVELDVKTNTSPLDYIAYLAGCMIPASSNKDQISKDIYILTLHDDTIYDTLYNDTTTNGGPYFKIEKTSYAKSYSDAYEIDIGYNTNTLVLDFQVDQNENYSLFYDYTNDLYPEVYTRRINNMGKWEDVYSPAFTSKNDLRKTRAEDVSWYTKVTKYPINASITIQGLLRPAQLMQYLRLNVIFPSGHKHISSGLYIVTKQIDNISPAGYKTTLSLTRIEGDDNFETESLAVNPFINSGMPNGSGGGQSNIRRKTYF